MQKTNYQLQKSIPFNKQLPRTLKQEGANATHTVANGKKASQTIYCEIWEEDPLIT